MLPLRSVNMVCQLIRIMQHHTTTRRPVVLIFRSSGYALCYLCCNQLLPLTEVSVTYNVYITRTSSGQVMLTGPFFGQIYRWSQICQLSRRSTACSVSSLVQDFMRCGGGPGQIKMCVLSKARYSNDGNTHSYILALILQGVLVNHLREYRPYKLVLLLQVLNVNAAVVQTAPQTGVAQHLCDKGV